MCLLPDSFLTRVVMRKMIYLSDAQARRKKGERKERKERGKKERGKKERVREKEERERRERAAKPMREEERSIAAAAW